MCTYMDVELANKASSLISRIFLLKSHITQNIEQAKIHMANVEFFMLLGKGRAFSPEQLQNKCEFHEIMAQKCLMMQNA